MKQELAKKLVDEFGAIKALEFFNISDVINYNHLLRNHLHSIPYTTDVEIILGLISDSYFQNGFLDHLNSINPNGVDKLKSTDFIETLVSNKHLASLLPNSFFDIFVKPFSESLLKVLAEKFGKFGETTKYKGLLVISVTSKDFAIIKQGVNLSLISKKRGTSNYYVVEENIYTNLVQKLYNAKVSELSDTINYIRDSFATEIQYFVELSNNFAGTLYFVISVYNVWSNKYKQFYLFDNFTYLIEEIVKQNLAGESYEDIQQYIEKQMY